MRRRHNGLLRWVLVSIAALVVIGAGALDATLLLATHHARAGLATGNARLPDAAATALGRKDYAGLSDLLAARTETEATAETHALASRAATAAGRFDEAARHAGFAASLSPGDPDAHEVAEEALDRALLARFRGPSRVLGGLALLGLLGAGLALLHRTARLRRRRAWVASLSPRLLARTSGLPPEAGPLLLDPRAGDDLVLDLWLGAPADAGRPPRPGPTLSVVLTQPERSVSLRLRPRRDVREDAVRIRVRDETLRRILSVPGPWHVRCRLDDRPAGEAALEVLPSPASASRVPPLLAPA